MVICVHGDLDGRMSELTRYVRDVMAGRNADGGLGVSDVVDAHPAQFRFFARLVMNPAPQVSWVKWLAILIDENPIWHLPPSILNPSVA